MKGITGLTWHNVGWLVLITFLSAMHATADGYLRLNWEMVTQVYTYATNSAENAGEQVGSLARQLDETTKTRYGADPIETRSQQCKSEINSFANHLTLQNYVEIKKNNPATKNEIHNLLGSPYCTSSIASDIWLVDETNILEIEYQPINIKLR